MSGASDMSERSVRNWNKGPLPSEKKDRRRKSTRPDPFAGVWAEEVEPLLKADVDTRSADETSRSTSQPAYWAWTGRGVGAFTHCGLWRVQRLLRASARRR